MTAECFELKLGCTHAGNVCLVLSFSTIIPTPRPMFVIKAVFTAEC